MASLFKDIQAGFAKVVNSAGKLTEPADAARPLPPYGGRLGAEDFSVSEGALLGLGALVPKTLAYEPQARLVGVCTPEGHVRLFGPELELCLQCAGGPVRQEHLIFPRPGLVLAMGVVSGGGGGWIARWWDLRASPGLGAKHGHACQARALGLRFGVSCAAVAPGAGLVFLGTDEGDVRVFDAGETPGLGSYCVPGGKLAPEMRRGKPAPPPLPGAPRHGPGVPALAPAPPGAPELLVAGAEGGAVLWSLEKHKVLRSFEITSRIASFAWHPSGSQFLAASFGDIALFAKSGTAALRRVPLPGGPSSSVSLLSWSEHHCSGAGAPGELGAAHGEVLLQRGAPGPDVLTLWGPGWAQTDSLFQAEGPVAGAVVCPPLADANEADGRSDGERRGVPCGCPCPPSLATRGSALSGLPVQSQLAVERLGMVPLVLVALGSPDARLVVRTVPPFRPLAWPASWGSMELAGATAFQLLPRGPQAAARSWDASPPPRKPAAAELPRDAQAEADAPGAGGVAPGGQQATVFVRDGALEVGATALPAGAELEPIDGWLALCPAEEDADDEDVGDAPQGDEGVRCDLPESTGIVTSQVSFSLSVCAELVLWSAEGEDIIVFDLAEQCTRWRGPHLASHGEVQHSPADVEPGAEHAVVASMERGELSVSCGGLPIFGPISLDWAVLAVGWRCTAGELRLHSVTAAARDPKAAEGEEAEAAAAAGHVDSRPVPEAALETPPVEEVSEDGAEGPPVVTQEPIEQKEAFAQEDLVEAMFSQRLAHFGAFVVSAERAPEVEPLRFADGWCAMSGGWQGLLCSGHQDGTVRIWLRSHFSLLLLHVVSVRPLTPLPWRPQAEAVPGADGGLQFQTPQQCLWYDGVDACPVVAASDGGAEAAAELADANRVTAVALEPSAGALAAGTAGGEVALFRWSHGPHTLSRAELARWRGGDAHAGEGGPSDMPASLPRGFACAARHRQHRAAVRWVRLVEPVPGRLHLLTADAECRLCIADCHSGEVLFSQALELGAAASPTAVSEPRAAASPGDASRPPCVTVDAVALAAGPLHVVADSPEQQLPTGPALPPGVALEPEGTGAYLAALSNGEVRQVAMPAMQVLDTRIRETRLPPLPGGAVLALHLAPLFLLVVQPAVAHVFPREEDGRIRPPYSFSFLKACLSAGVLEVNGELVLALLLSNMFVEMLALPSLRLLASCDVGERAAAFLSAPAADATFCPDGYFLLQSVQPDGGTRAWWASVLKILGDLDKVASVVTLAQIAQATEPSGPSEPAPPPSASAAQQSSHGRSGGFFGLFGAKPGGPKPLRDCVLPSGELPAEVNALRVDQTRGLPPAARDPFARPAPPPPPPPPPHPQGQPASQLFDPAARQRAGASASSSSQSRAAAASAALSEAAAMNAQANERGEKLGLLGDKSAKMADDAKNFLDMAKQLNAKQSNSWF